MHRSTPSVLLVSAFFLLFALTGCDSGGSNGVSDNEFSLDITPSGQSSSSIENVEDKTVNGFSFFADGEVNGEQFFAIYLTGDNSFSEESTPEGLFGWIARTSGQPNTGTYDLSDADLTSSQFGAALWEDFSEDLTTEQPFYVTQSGTLTIDESSDTEVAGSIDAEATGYTFTNGTLEDETVSITGSFTATNVEEFIEVTSPGVGQ